MYVNKINFKMLQTEVRLEFLRVLEISFVNMLFRLIFWLLVMLLDTFLVHRIFARGGLCGHLYCAVQYFCTAQYRLYTVNKH